MMLERNGLLYLTSYQRPHHYTLFSILHSLERDILRLAEHRSFYLEIMEVLRRFSTSKSSKEQKIPLGRPAITSPPPPYSAATRKGTAFDLTAAVGQLQLDVGPKPLADLCLAHLKLLEAFYVLRDEISQKDGLFGIRDETLFTKDERRKTEQVLKIREKQWAVYVTKAALRFEIWWKQCIRPQARKIPMYEMHRFSKPSAGPALHFDDTDLPPLGKSTIALYCGRLR